jgi:hypothetical protein
MKKLVMFVVFALLLTGCGAPEEVVEAQISNAVYNTVQAFTPIPSNTPFNTYTPYPTNTPYRTFTPFPTYTIPPTQTARVVTPTSTPTPKFTPTDTSTPTRTSTSTKTPNATQTQQAFINATKGADATATKAAQYAGATATKAVQNAKATEIAQYEKIDIKELVTYADSHVGEKVWVDGRIFNINGNTELQIWLGWTYDAAYIVMREPFSGLYEDNWITVYGEILGETCFENAYGADTCQPALYNAFYVKK